MASSLVPGCLAMTDLLSIREKGVLFTLLDPQYKLIKTTVAQVLVPEEAQGGESPGWSCLDCGAICLIQDASVHSYFFCRYCVKHPKLLWKQELYVPFRYTAVRQFFHTFPADSHQVGFNFANHTEAEEFLLAVKAVQKEQEKMKDLIEMSNSVEETSSGSNPLDSRIQLPALQDEKKHFSINAPSTEVTATTSSFKDLDAPMRRMLMKANLTDEDLKSKDIAEAVDYIINQFGGLKAVQKELRKCYKTGPVSQTLPRTASMPLAMKKGPLPPVPTRKYSPRTLHHSPGSPWIPPPPSAPEISERIKKSASFNYVGSPSAAEKGDQILAALRDVFKQKQLLQRSMNPDGDQMGPDVQ
ncbi:uncharacterized protein V6R79_008632 [Siganus canaliculatus]